MKTILVRDDDGAARLASERGVVVPPIYEKIETPLGTSFRQMAMGWLVVPACGGAPRGYVILFSSADGEDWEIMADGGWCLSGARTLFRFIFDESGQSRVSARCLLKNGRNIRALLRMGFKVEGRKRLLGGDVVSLGMFRDECVLLKRGS